MRIYIKIETQEEVFKNDSNPQLLEVKVKRENTKSQLEFKHNQDVETKKKSQRTTNLLLGVRSNEDRHGNGGKDKISRFHSYADYRHG